MSGGGGGETTQKQEPWEGAQPFLEDLYGQAARQFDQPSFLATPWREHKGALQGMFGETGDWREQLGGYYDVPTSDFARGVQTGMMPISSEQEEAQAGILDFARGGGATPGLFPAASGELEATLGGQYLGANPHLNQMAESAARPMRESFMEQTLPALTSQFAAAGQLGSGGHESVARGATEDLNRTLADMRGNLFGQAYESERGRMQQAAALSPQVGQAARADVLGNYGLIEDVGASRRDIGQSFIDTLMQESGIPDQRLQQYAALVGANPASALASQTQPYHRNRLAGGLGGAASGAAMGSMIMPGWGTAIGAGIGGLAGMM